MKSIFVAQKVIVYPSVKFGWGDQAVIPPDMPDCGFSGELCQNQTLGNYQNKNRCKI
jgi:hypothetical protein